MKFFDTLPESRKRKPTLLESNRPGILDPTDPTDVSQWISGTFGSLATVGHGGNVQNANGWDIIFTSDPAGNNKLDHEIESYDPATGTVNFWVRVPTLSHSADTVIYIRYGSSVVVTSQENRPGVWGSNYHMVLHLGEAAAPYHDSSSNSYASTGGGTTYPTQGAGKIGQGQVFNGGSAQYIVYSQSQSPNPTGAISLEAWVRDAGSANVQLFGKSSYQMSTLFGGAKATGTFLAAAGNISVQVAGSQTVNDNNWHHIAVTAPPTGVVSLYVDGVLDNWSTNSQPILGTSPDSLLIGACQACSAVSGALDEVRISNAVRSGDWIATEYNNQNSPATFESLGQENAPSITVINPASAERGAIVTITGSGFSASTGSVTFNGQSATVTTWSDTSITAIVPTGATTGPVVVTTGGTQTNAYGFTVLLPVISNLSPGSGDPGTLVVITGAYFDPLQASGGVTFAGVPAPIVSWSAGSITAQVPVGAVSGNVVVTAPNTGISNAAPFTVSDDFQVTLISPSMGPVGSTVTILGGGFGSAQGSGSVLFFSGVPATVTSWSENQIVVAVPPGTQTGLLRITTNGTDGVLSPSPFVIATTTQVTDSLGHVSSYTSGGVGGTWVGVSSTGSGCSSCTVRGNVSSTFDALGNVLSSTDELGHVANFAYDAASNLASQSAQLDTSTTVATSYTYNSFGEPLTVTDPLGNVTTNTYDTNGNLLTITSPAPDSTTPASVTHFAYDNKGQLTQITDPLNHATTLAYTAAGLISTITDAQSNVTTYQYDARGNRTSVKDALNNTTTFTYDLADRLTKITYPDATFVSFAYDARGRRTSVTDQNGRVTTYAYDDADRVTSVTDAANNVTHYAYDSENNLLSITDAANHTTSFDYDSFGRVTQTSFPSTLVETYLYDAAGNLTSKTDRNGHSILYVYDALNRLTHKGYPDSTGVG